MAEPTELVQVVKQESSSGGGDAADDVEWGSNPINDFEDVLSSAGVALQEPGGSSRDQGVKIYRDGNVMRFKDGENSSKTLTELLSTVGNADFGKLIFKEDGGLVYNNAGDVILKVAS